MTDSSTRRHPADPTGARWAGRAGRGHGGRRTDQGTPSVLLVDDGGREITLSDRELALLNHLVTRVGEVCRREELLHDVRGMDFDRVATW